MIYRHIPHAVDEAFAATPREQWSDSGEAINIWGAWRPGAEFPGRIDTPTNPHTRTPVSRKSPATTEGRRAGTLASAESRRRQSIARALKLGQEIYDLVIAGATSVQIGRKLGIGPDAVRDYLQIYCKTLDIPRPKRGTRGVPPMRRYAK